MRYFQIVTMGLCVAVMSTSTTQAGEVMIYPYVTSENYCPANLQPVAVMGEISCGQPNTHVTYQQMMRHQQRGKTKRRSNAQTYCPVGTKGC